METGFFPDTTLCIGCEEGELAWKQWNQLLADAYALTGMSYDNTAALGAATWRHVAFIEQFDGDSGRFMGLAGSNGDDGASAVAAYIASDRPPDERHRSGRRRAEPCAPAAPAQRH